MENKKNKEKYVEMEVFEKLYELYGVTRQGLIFAGEILESYGWCPKAKDNEMHPYIRTCKKIDEKGFRGCFWCIAMYFLFGRQAVTFPANTVRMWK